MIKHVLTIIWNQRRSNGWIFAELLVVLGTLWAVLDVIVANLCVYFMPLGYDVTNCYNIRFASLSPKEAGYVTDSLSDEAADLDRILTHFRQCPEVEGACLHFRADPYSPGYWWTTMYKADADSTQKDNYWYRCSVVSPEYFDVLRIKDQHGEPVKQSLTSAGTQLVITPDIEAKYYPGQSSVGQRMKHGIEDTETYPVSVVCSPIRSDEYVKSEPFFYRVQRASVMSAFINEKRASNMTCILRMRPGFKEEQIERFLENMGDRTISNNLYVSGGYSLAKHRLEVLKDRTDALKKKLVLVSFMLVNVFFGIIGTFWLRIQYRKGEMGLRTALGATRRSLLSYLNCEGVSLLALAVPLVLFFILNALYFDLPDTAHLPYSWWRFGMAFGGAFLLLSLMIIVGIWLPARKIAKMNPAEALHYE